MAPALKRTFSDMDDMVAMAPNAPPVKWVRIGNSMRFKKIGIMEAEHIAPTPSPSPRQETEPPTHTNAARESAPSPSPPRNLPFSQLKTAPPFMGPRRRLAPFPVVGMALWRY